MVPGTSLNSHRTELNSGVPASSSQDGTQFRGNCFSYRGGTQFRGNCFLLPRRNSVPPSPVLMITQIKRSFYKLQLLTNKNIVKRKIGCYNIAQGNQSEAACPLRRVLPSRRKKGGLPMITYSDLIQFCIFIVSLISLIRQIYEDKRK